MRVGIPDEPTLDVTTTMQPRCFVLSKRFSSYTFHQECTVGDVKDIPETVHQLITSHLGWDSGTSLKIRYYLVLFDSKLHHLSGPPLIFPQPDEASQAELDKNKIREIVNDDYLENNCREIDSHGLGGDQQQNVIVVGIGRSAPTPVFQCEC